jgi:long-chain acyl-CoA synthetase
MSKKRSWKDRTDDTLGPRQRQHLAPLGPFRRAIAPAVYAIIWCVMRGAFRLEVRGRERLPETGPVVLAPNHTSYLDPFAVAVGLGYRRVRHTYWGGWVGAIFRNGLTRFVSRLGQAVPIDPHQGVFSSLAVGAAVLRRGKNLVWFAEGRRSPTGQLQCLRPGVAALVASFEATVVPVFIRGGYEAMPCGSRFPRLFRRVTVVFGEPLRAADLQQRGDGSDPRTRIVDGLYAELSSLARTWGDREALRN